MNSVRDTVEFYNEEANQYDLKRYWSESGRLWNQLQLSVVSDFVRMIGIKNPIVMDLACGTGRYAIESAKYASQVYAVDGSTQMLEIAKKKCDSKGILEKFTFVESDAGRIDNSSDTVNLVLCMNALSHLPHLSKVFSEVRRVLKPDGLFIFNYPNLTSYLFPLGYWISRKQRAIFEDVYTRWLTRGEIDWLLNNNGFRSISEQGLVLPTAVPIRGLYRTRVFGKTFKNKAIVNLCPMVFVLAGCK